VSFVVFVEGVFADQTT